MTEMEFDLAYRLSGMFSQNGDYLTYRYATMQRTWGVVIGVLREPLNQPVSWRRKMYPALYRFPEHTTWSQLQSIPFQM